MFQCFNEKYPKHVSEFYRRKVKEVQSNKGPPAKELKEKIQT